MRENSLYNETSRPTFMRVGWLFHSTVNKMLPGMGVAAVHVLAPPGLLGALGRLLGGSGVEHFRFIPQLTDNHFRDDLVDLGDQGGVIRQEGRGQVGGLLVHESSAGGVQHSVTDGG